MWGDAAAPRASAYRTRATATIASPGGRWSALTCAPDGVEREEAVELYAHTLLRRYGIVCRRLLAREPFRVPWRELLRVYRRLEARGDVRGGRFVSGVPGEQFALSDAVALARQIRRSRPHLDESTVCAADPLNLQGIITPGPRIPAIGATRVTVTNGESMSASAPYSP